MRCIYGKRKFQLKGGFSGDSDYLEYNYYDNQTYVVDNSGVKHHTTAYSLEYMVKSVGDGRWVEIT